MSTTSTIEEKTIKVSGQRKNVLVRLAEVLAGVELQGAVALEVKAALRAFAK